MTACNGNNGNGHKGKVGRPPGPQKEFGADSLRVVHDMAVKGKTQEQIGKRLGISARTVRSRIEDDEEFSAAYKEGHELFKAGIVFTSVETLKKCIPKAAKDPRYLPAVFFALKTMGGYRETTRTELTDGEGKPLQGGSVVVVYNLPTNNRDPVESQTKTQDQTGQADTAAPEGCPSPD